MKNEPVQCEIYETNDKKVSHAKQELQTYDVTKMAKMFKALSDETRMKIALALCDEDKLCVCDVATIIDSSTATASHHLRLLHKNGLAKSERIGKMVYYSLDDDHIVSLIQLTKAHAKEGKGS